MSVIDRHIHYIHVLFFSLNSLTPKIINEQNIINAKKCLFFYKTVLNIFFKSMSMYFSYFHGNQILNICNNKCR